MADENEELDRLRQEAEDLHGKIQESKESAADVSMGEYMEKHGVEPCTKVQIRTRRTLRAHWGKIYGIHWALDSKHLVSTAQDGKLIVWDCYSGNKKNLIPLRSIWVMTCAYAPSGSFVCSGGLDNVCSIYCLKTRDRRIYRELTGHTAYISGARFIDDQQVVTSSGDRTCVLWDVETGQKVTTFTHCYREGGAVLCLTLAPDGKTFVSGDTENQAKVWDLRDGQCHQTFYMDEHCNAVSFFPNGHQFATGSDDCSCRLYDLRSGCELGFYARDDNVVAVSSVAFSRSGRLLLSACDDCSVNVWDTLRQELLGSLSGHENRVSSIGVTDDGKALATGSWDTFVKVWN